MKIQPEFQAKINSLIQQLDEKKGFDISMVIGVDGFVDILYHAVSSRQNAGNYTRMKTITEFGQKVLNAAGLSTNFEIIPIYTKLGGNGPIFSNALLEYGAKLTYVGALGYPQINPVFEDMVQKCEKVYALCDPDRTMALEFEDGKIMLGQYSELHKITWEMFKEALGGPRAIASMLQNVQLFGMENWTMVSNMSSIWLGLINEVFPFLPDQKHKSLAFFDLADPEKRAKSDILEAMNIIGRFEEKFNVVLGLNEKELYEIAEVLSIVIPTGLARDERLKYTLVNVYEKLGIYCLVVHPQKEAACCVGGEYFYAKGPYCKNPVLTTGAGDNFNAGFCLGFALGFDPLCSLILGNATSGFYVRNAKSPSYDEQMAFLAAWAKGDF